MTESTLIDPRLAQGYHDTVQQINTILLETYRHIWHIGKHIVKFEQHGSVLFGSKYQLHLPDRELLTQELFFLLGQAENGE